MLGRGQGAIAISVPTLDITIYQASIQRQSLSESVNKTQDTAVRVANYELRHNNVLYFRGVGRNPFGHFVAA